MLNVPVLLKLPVDVMLATVMLGFPTRLLADKALPVRDPVNVVAVTLVAVTALTIMLGLFDRPVADPVRAPVNVVALTVGAVIVLVVMEFVVIRPELLNEPVLLMPVDVMLATLMLGLPTRLLADTAEPVMLALIVFVTVRLLNVADCAYTLELYVLLSVAFVA